MQVEIDEEFIIKIKDQQASLVLVAPSKKVPW